MRVAFSWWLPGVPLSHYRQHVSADGGVVHITPHAAASQIAKQRQSERITHGVDVQVRDKLCQSLPSQEDRAHTLSQQSEVRKQTGLHQQPVPQEHKLNRPREDDVETATSPLQNLMTRHTQVSCVHHEVNIHVPVRDRGGRDERGKQNHKTGNLSDRECRTCSVALLWHTRAPSPPHPQHCSKGERRPQLGVRPLPGVRFCCSGARDGQRPPGGPGGQ